MQSNIKTMAALHFRRAWKETHWTFFATLENVYSSHFETFKLYLSANTLENFSPIPIGQPENKDRSHTAGIMMERYPEEGSMKPHPDEGTFYRG